MSKYKELSFMQNYILRCDFNDIFKGKIPKDILNNKKIKSHIVYVHKTEDKLLFPLEITQYRKINDGKDILYTHSFYEIFQQLYAMKANVALSNKRLANTLNLMKVNIDYLLKKNIYFQYLFFDIQNSIQLYDNISDIDIYFISKNSYQEYEKYLVDNEVYI